jgi:hypothetical protein
VDRYMLLDCGFFQRSLERNLIHACIPNMVSVGGFRVSTEEETYYLCCKWFYRARRCRAVLSILSVGVFVILSKNKTKQNKKPIIFTMNHHG